MADAPIRLDEVWAFCNARLDDEWHATVGIAPGRPDPSRQRKDIAFKRALLTEHEPTLQAAEAHGEVTPMLVCPTDGDDCTVTQALAAIYDDHDDYNEDWRP